MEHFCVVMNGEKRKAYIALALVSFFWGTTYLASRISAHYMPGLFVSGVRQFISGLLMVAYFKSKGYQWPDKKSLLKIAIQGVFLLTFSNGLQTKTQKKNKSRKTTKKTELVPLFVALFSILLLRFAKFT